MKLRRPKLVSPGGHVEAKVSVTADSWLTCQVVNQVASQTASWYSMG